MENLQKNESQIGLYLELKNQAAAQEEINKNHAGSLYKKLKELSETIDPDCTLKEIGNFGNGQIIYYVNKNGVLFRTRERNVNKSDYHKIICKDDNYNSSYARHVLGIITGGL